MGAAAARLLLLLAGSARAAAAAVTAADSSARRKVELTPSGEVEADLAGAALAVKREVEIGPDGLARAAAPGTPPDEAEALYEGAAGTVLQAVKGSVPAGSIKIGTPPVVMQVIFDTGSDKLVAKTWDTVKRELQVVDGGAADNVKPTGNMYDHNKSTSYVRQFMRKGHEKLPKQGYIAYGSGQAVTEEGNDTIRVGGRRVEGFPFSEILQDSLAVLHKKGGAEGVFGLQHMQDRTRGESFFSVCRDRGLMTAFGYCRGRNDTGTFLWGDNATDGKAIPVKGKIHWAIDLSRVEIAIYSGAAGNHTSSVKAKHQIHHPNKFKDVLKHGSKMPVLDQDGIRALLSQRDTLAEYVRAKYAGDGAVFADGTDTGGARWNGTSSRFSAASPLDGQTSRSKGMDWMQAHGKEIADDHLFDSDQALKPGSLKFCHEGKCTAIIDTGSNIIAGPLKTISKISKMLNVKTDCSNLKDLPPLKLHFGSFEATIPAKAYTMKVSMPSWAKSAHGRSRGSAAPTRSLTREAAGASLQDASSGAWAEAGAWGRVFQDLHENRGIDLGPHFHGVNLSHLLSMSELCIPALVPMDKETPLGALWVVGTPLFEGYYTRWSWPKHESHPTIYMKELAKASACGAARPNAHHAKTELAADPAVGAAPQGAGRVSLMRAEARRPSVAPNAPVEVIVGAGLDDDLAQPRLVEVDDIRFPHWAHHIDDL